MMERDPATIALPSQPTPLEYAQRPGTFRSRVARRGAGVVLALVLIAVATRYGGTWWRHAAALYWQDRCAAYALLAGLVVYDEDATRVPAMLNDHRYVAVTPTPRNGPDLRSAEFSRIGSAPAGIAAAAVPGCLERLTGRAFTTAHGGARNVGLLYLGERRDASGGRWIIAVHPAEPRTATRPVQLEFDATSIHRGTAWRAPAVTLHTATFGVAGARPAPHVNPYGPFAAPSGRYDPWTLRMYAGQPHPTDESRFVIPFDAEGQRGLVEGRVDDRGRVSFEVTEGPPDLVLDVNERAELQRLSKLLAAPSDLSRLDSVTP